MKRLRHIKMLSILEAIKFALFVVMVLMFINFNAKVANQTAQTKEVAGNTNSIVRSQADILAAIKQVTTDGNINSAQQTAIIICMLQVPITERTTDLQTQCRDQAKTITSDNAVQTTQSSNGTTDPASSPNNSTNSTTSQPDNLQSSPETPPAEQPPVEIMGISLCVPLTNVCVRQ